MSIKYFIKSVGWMFFAIIISLGMTCCTNDQQHTGKQSGDSSSLGNKPGIISDSNIQANALPFALSFEPQNYIGKPALPCLQSFAFGVTAQGYIVVIGGRRQGLHTFQNAPVNNFIPDSSNNFIYVINPNTGDFSSFNVDSLNPELSAPLQSTNMESYFDAKSGLLYLVGGYGWKADKSNMITFNSIITFPLDSLAGKILAKRSANEISKLFNIGHDDHLAVTGGELFKLDGKFYLVFGQRFDGQYRAFGGTDFKQKYTEEVRVFTLYPNKLKILSYGANTNSDSTHPFHRRDGNIINDIDPSTGKMRITAFGGVFQQGIIGPYVYPVYINSPSTPTVDYKPAQKFSQYECPVITIYDSSAKGSSVYHSFFGGIGHYYYSQTPAQDSAYLKVTQEGRNDGFPFVEDISCFVEGSDKSYKEYILPNTIPGQRLLGASTKFILNRKLILNNSAYSNGVIKLSAIPSMDRVLIGYIYGGIEAQNPLPLIPNSGTFVSNTLFAVYLMATPSGAIPASKGIEAVKADKNLLRH